MSMLAEPRRKKNYVLTPRGKPLYDDDSRFGSKMLQKMGWTKGKGLGAKESGQTDFVRVNFKSDAGGLGFEQRDDQWTQHEHGFNGLLQSLHAQTKDANDEMDEEEKEEDIVQATGFGFKSEKKTKVKVTLSGESLEEKSKKSKARVHYKKFTRGKDLSQYSEKDLANIFGKKAIEVNVGSGSDSECDNEEANATLLVESKSTSITDYFKGKMEKREKEDQMNIDGDLIPAQDDNDNFLKNSASSISDYFMQKMKERKTRNEIQQNELESKHTDNTAVAYNNENTRKKAKKEKNSSIKDTIEETIPEAFCPVSEKRKKKKKGEVKNFADVNTVEKISIIHNDDSQKQDEIEKNCDSKKSKKNYPLAFQKCSNELMTSKTQQSLDVKVSVKLIKNVNKKNTNKFQKPLANSDDYSEKFNIYTISSYVAEKFRRAELEKFKGSNLKDLNGYSFDENVKLNIVQNPRDEERIIKFWEGSLNKYSENSRPKNIYKASKDTSLEKVPKPKYKKKQFNISKHKRKNAFKLGI